MAARLLYGRKLSFISLEVRVHSSTEEFVGLKASQLFQDGRFIGLVLDCHIRTLKFYQNLVESFSESDHRLPAVKAIKTIRISH
jgi:hypothetical protein